MIIRKGTRNVIKADWRRYEQKKCTILGVLYKVLIKTYVSPSSLSFAFLFWMRIYQSGNSFVRFFAKFKLARFALKYGIDISRNAKIGEGAYFPHITAGVVFRGNVRIGNNLTCLHGVTIGNDGRSSKGFTIIGDNCFIGAGAKIFGDIELGDNVTVGGGAVVVSNVPDNVTVAGIPARIISRVNKDEG